MGYCGPERGPNPWAVLAAEAIVKSMDITKKSVQKIMHSGADEFEVYIKMDKKDVERTTGWLEAFGIGIQHDGYTEGKLIPTPLNKEQLKTVLGKYLYRITKIDTFRKVNKPGYNEERIATYVISGDAFVKEKD